MNTYTTWAQTTMVTWLNKQAYIHETDTHVLQLHYQGRTQVLELSFCVLTEQIKADQKNTMNYI